MVAKFKGSGKGGVRKADKSNKKGSKGSGKGASKAGKGGSKGSKSKGKGKGKGRKGKGKGKGKKMSEDDLDKQLAEYMGEDVINKRLDGELEAYMAKDD